MPGHASGRLTLHAADLDTPGCFDDVFRGCHGVAHLSHVSTYDDEDYVKRVCDHIIESVNLSGSVNRVVVTSSIAAVISEQDMQELVRRPVLFEGRYPDEQNPNRTTARGQGYSIGKVIAERAFADAARSSGRWDAITCCPGDNVGPILSRHQKERGPWQHQMRPCYLAGTAKTSSGLTGPGTRLMYVTLLRPISACLSAMAWRMASDLSPGQPKPVMLKTSVPVLTDCYLNLVLLGQHCLIPS